MTEAPTGAGQGSSGPTRKVTRQKRPEFSNGRAVWKWVEVEEEMPLASIEKPHPGELAKEFKFSDDISIGDLWPSLKGGRFDALNLTKTRMLWLAKDVTPTMTAGLWFETDVEFRGILQPISDVLHDVFAQEHPALHLSAHLGVVDAWSDELIASGFTLRGTMENIKVGFGEFLYFRNAGIQLHIAPGKTSGGPLTSMYSFFGTLHLHVPNAVTPLVLGYSMEPKAETLDITMTFGDGERWESVFGVKGLDLDQVTIVTTMVKSDIKKTLEFSINAKWSIGDIPIELSGHIKKSGSSLRAYIKSFTMDDLRKLFNSLTGSHLEPVEQDVRLNDITVEISQGRLMFYGELWVDGHRAVKAEVLVTVDGIRISGAVNDLHIGEDVHIRDAQIELIVGDVSRPKVIEDKKGNAADGATAAKQTDTKVETKSQGKAVAAIIRGNVKIKTDNINLDFKVAAAILKPKNGSARYFVYGQLDFDNFSIGQILGGDMEKGHPMDLQLGSVTLVVASHDGIDTQGLNASRFPVSQGIFLCAELKSVPFVGSLCKASKPEDRYVLQAGYSSSSGVSINILLPENIRIELSPNIVSGPLVLTVQTKPLAIKFAAKLWITPAGQKDPLELTLAVSANEVEALAYAEMNGWWENPLDLSPRLKIGERLTLEVKLNYQQLAATGMPSALAFQGGFVVDEVDKYFLALNLGSDPKETLVELKMKRLDDGMIINLINAVAQVDIQKPKYEIIRFEDVNVYASPMGCIVGSQVFPPGFVIQGKAFIFGKKIEIDCRIGKEGLELAGEIEGFNLGPLAIKGGKRADGSQSKNALLDLRITKARQHFEISGSVSLWDLETSIFILAETMPSQQLEFNFELAWSDLLKFKVDGKLIRPAGDNEKALNNLDNADFQLHAVLEQNILEQISNAMQNWFMKAQISVKDGIDSAKREVDKAKAEFERQCAAAQEKVREAEATFNAAMDKVESEFRQKEAEAREARREKDLWVLSQEKKADEEIRAAKADEEIRAAKADLDAKQKNFEDDIDDKKRKLSEAQREGDEAIGGKIRDLQSKRVALQRDFGSAIDAIRTARSRVWDKQREWLLTVKALLTCSGDVDYAKKRLQDAEDDYDDAGFFNKLWRGCVVVARQAEVWALQAALAAAELILRGAQFIVEGVAYNIAKGLVDAAEGALIAARAVWDGLIAGAKHALDGVAKVHEGIISAAKWAVTKAHEVALGIKKAAAEALGALITVWEKALAVAREAVTAVAKGAMWVAFQAALGVLEAAKNNTTWVDIAKGALTAAEAVATAALAAAAWLAQRLCDTLNIKRVELSSSLKQVTRGDGFDLRIVGVIMGQDFDFSATWSPRNMVAFIAKLCQKLWDDFIDSAGSLFEADSKTNKPAIGWNENEGKPALQSMSRTDLIISSQHKDEKSSIASATSMFKSRIPSINSKRELADKKADELITNFHEWYWEFYVPDNSRLSDAAYSAISNIATMMYIQYGLGTNRSPNKEPMSDKMKEEVEKAKRESNYATVPTGNAVRLIKARGYKPFLPTELNEVWDWNKRQFTPLFLKEVGQMEEIFGSKISKDYYYEMTALLKEIGVP